MRDSALPNLQACHRCRYVMERTTNVTGEAGPGPGDVSLCIRCGHLHVFDEHMNMAEPTPEQLQVLQADADLWRFIGRAKVAIAVASGNAVVVAVRKGGRHVGN